MSWSCKNPCVIQGFSIAANVSRLSFSSIVQAMSGIETDVEDHFMDGLGVLVEMLFTHEEAAVQAVIEQQSTYWSFP